MPAGEHLEEHEPEAVEVGPGRCRFAAELLGRQVVGRLAGRACVSAASGGGDVGRYAEVREVGVPLLVEEDVRRLDVAVDDSLPVSGAKRGADVLDYHEGVVDVQRAPRN